MKFDKNPLNPKFMSYFLFAYELKVKFLPKAQQTVTLQQVHLFKQVPSLTAQKIFMFVSFF